MPALAPAKAARIRAAIARARARGHTPRPPTPILHPEAAARAYVTRLRTLVSEQILAAYLPVLAELPAIVSQARQERGDAAEWRADASGAGRVASAAVRAAAAASSIPQARVAGAAKAAAGDVGAHVQAGLGRQVKEVLGIDLMADPRAKARVAAFVHENVKLIVGITPKLAAEVEAIILAGLTSGQLHETMALAIKSRMKIAIDRAELIAVDQVGKIFGQVAAARAQDLGATHFTWLTARDERVRGNPTGRYPKAKPSHYERHGKRYAYADPPKGKNGEPELPGVPIRCRCTGQPDLTTVPGMEGVAEEVAAMPTPAGGVEETEEEAAKLMAEVEAMMAGLAVKPARAPLASVPAPAPPPALPPQAPPPVPPPPPVPAPSAAEKATAPPPGAPASASLGNYVKLPPAPPSKHTAAEAIKYEQKAYRSVKGSRAAWEKYRKARVPDLEKTTPYKGLTVSMREFGDRREEFAKTLSPAEVDAALFYSHKGDSVLNKSLREGTIETKPAVMETAAVLDKVIASSPVPVDTYVTRGIDGKWAKRFASEIEPGDIYQEPGYTSTSATTGFPGVQLRIRIPAGQPAAPIPSRYPEENELLLPRGSYFLVTGKRVDGKKTIIDVDLITPDEGERAKEEAESGASSE